MDNFVLFCKSFDKDFERFKKLKKSIDKYNVENIPFYLSCPKKDIDLFNTIEHNNDYLFEILADEDILENQNYIQDWRTQQIVKLKFYKKNLCNFYSCIDSDSFFIKDFKISDFMYNEETPYIVMYENKYFKEICSILGDKNIFDEIKKIKKYFNRNGKDYWFYHVPVLSTKVLKSLEENIDSIENLIELVPLEYVWHGEYLLYSNIIPYIPCESNFKFFNYQFEYEIWKNAGENIDDISKNYLGIILQNRWVKNKNYKNNAWNKLIRRFNRIKHYIRTDRDYLIKDYKFYHHFMKNLLKITIKGEL